MVFGSLMGGGGTAQSLLHQQIAIQQQHQMILQQQMAAAQFFSNGTCSTIIDNVPFIFINDSTATSSITSMNVVGFGGGGGTASNTSTSTCTGGGNGGIFYYTGSSATEIVVDEEEYLNNVEYYELARTRGVAFRIRTAEQKRLAEEAAERARIEHERVHRLREEAKQRARELLVSHLTPEQRETFDKNRWFVVVGGKTKTKYRIRTDYGVAGNIDVLSGERRVATLCCHCRSEIPEGDQYLAQKIALMYDEETFLRTANRRAA